MTGKSELKWVKIFDELWKKENTKRTQLSRLSPNFESIISGVRTLSSRSRVRLLPTIQESKKTETSGTRCSKTVPTTSLKSRAVFLFAMTDTCTRLLKVAKLQTCQKDTWPQQLKFRRMDVEISGSRDSKWARMYCTMTQTLWY